MDINTAVSLKGDCERKILDILRAFTKETGCDIVGLSISHYRDNVIHGDVKTPGGISSVIIDVRLG